MSSNLLIWFILFDSDTGQPYKGTTADKVSISSSADVADFRKAVKADKSSLLAGIDSSQLLVYKYKSAFDNRNADEGKQEPLKSSCPLVGLGETEEEALIVVVQSSIITSLPSGSHTQNSMASHPRDEVISDNNLHLLLLNDVNKFLDYMINKLAPFNPTKPYHAYFLDNCLEYCLDRRHTSYTLDNLNNIKLLVDVSGSGKTRQLLELLYSQPGYYFVLDTQITDFGSRDMRLCRYYSSLHPGTAEFLIKLLFYVHSYVCSYLYDLGYDKPDKILVAQLHPITFFGCDLFAELYESLAKRSEFIYDLHYPTIKHSFDFVAIDEIQESLAGDPIFKLCQSINGRPFFSPLVYVAKHILMYTTFVVSGTGINFHYLKELLLSGSFKASQFMSYNFISDLKPLDKDQVESYIHQILNNRNMTNDQINKVVSMVCSNPLFIGRGRFVASILDSILEGTNVQSAICEFAEVLSKPENSKFPLRFYCDDMKLKRNSLDIKVGDGWRTFEAIVRDGLIRYLMTGNATLFVQGQHASDMVRYGVGFCIIRGNDIQSIELKELAVIECLRYLIPVSSLVTDICFQLLSFPKPQMVGYILEYLVGFALVAGLHQEKPMNLKSTNSDFITYLDSNDETEILYPDHLCGPDIVYKYKGTVYIVQVKFVDKISKQARLNACHTTDPKRFYWNKNSNCLLAGFEETQQTICHKLEPFNIQRLVFLHTTTKTTDGMDDVEVINQKLRPYFFDLVHKDMWALLNKLRYNFKQ